MNWCSHRIQSEVLFPALSRHKSRVLDLCLECWTFISSARLITQAVELYMEYSNVIFIKIKEKY